MKRSIIILLHLVFWVVYSALVILSIYALFGPEDSSGISEEDAFAIVAFTVFLPAIISFYTFYWWLFPRYFRKRKFWHASLYGIGIAAGATLLGFIILLPQIAAECRADMNTPQFRQVVGMISGINLLCGLIALVIRSFATWFDEVRQKEALLRRNHEMELALVKAQLDPHFLFNTINNIDVLILKNADEASDYLNRLSDIMRFMLYETKSEQIPLAKELAYIEKYIALQKIRTANENYVDYSVTGSPAGHWIAPMVFIPLIENAFKHTTNKKAQHAIRIHIAISEEAISMTCSNPTDSIPKPQTAHNGLGNELIRKRLNLIYPEQHQLEVRRQRGRYVVRLSLQTAQTQASNF